MEEYKIIPQAPDYKINRNEEVIRTINGKPLLALAGGKVLLKKPDGTMQSFMTADLVKELFDGEKIIPNSEEKAEESNTNENEDADLIKESVDVIGANIVIEKPTEHPESKIPKEKKEKVKKAIQKKVGVVADGILGQHTKIATTGEVTRILELDCSESMKIWKLHQAGCSNEEILAHLKLPKEKNKKCLNTIWNYKHNASMRKKADLK